MALQVGLGTSKIFLIIGASVAGSILLKNGSLTDFLQDTYKVFWKHLNKEGDQPKGNSVDASLIAQVTRLRQELSRLAAERSTVTVITGSSKRNGIFTSLAIPAFIIGAAGYGYLRWKGFCISDLMYVTRRSMSNAVTTVSKQMEQVSTALTATKQQLSSKLEHLSSNLDQSIEMQEALKDQVEVVHCGVSRVGLEIETVQRLMEGLEGKIHRIESKQDIATKGIVFLCSFVQQLHGVQQPEALQVPNRPHLGRSPLAFGNERSALPFGSSDVRGLQFFSQALQPSTAEVQNEGGASNSSPASRLHRTATFSVGSMRSSVLPGP
eukprot:c24876_g1_i1 orf=214-1185(+)